MKKEQIKVYGLSNAKYVFCKCKHSLKSHFLTNEEEIMEGRLWYCKECDCKEYKYYKK